jgi:chemotaxis signal transduction protein
LEKLQEIHYAKLENCGFHQSEVKFLGYIISRNGICMDIHKVQTIVNWATLASIWDVQYFLGFANLCW